MILPAIHSATGIILCLLILTIWLTVAWLHRRVGRVLQFTAVVVRVFLAVAFWKMMLQAVATVWETSAALPEWWLAMLVAIVTETVFLCSTAESATAEPASRTRWIARLLPVPRWLAIGILGFMLLQPTFFFEEVTESARTVAVVLDISDSMNLPARRRPDDKQTRRQVADQLLVGAGKPGLLESLRQRYNVNVYLMGATARPLAASAGAFPEDWTVETPDWSRSTRVAATLRRIHGDVALSELSGVLLLTDGCDHSEIDLQNAAAPLRNNTVPCSSVVIGSRAPVRDGEIVSLQAPSQIYHGDGLELTAVIRADQLSGQTAVVRLYADDELIDERSLPINSDRQRENVSFRHRPEDAGMHGYRAELSGLVDEETSQNNSAAVQTWVSSDRLRVLLVDERPRWEFRYLRNLLAGRDRSIYLQAALLAPDRLAGVPAPAIVRASALRAFDDCQANALPDSIDDWLKFDVIMLGDVSPQRLGADGLRALQRFVQDQGGSLVLMAGPSHMPHAYQGTQLEDLSPALIANAPPLMAPQTPLRFRPTKAGQNHVVLQRAGMATEQAWSSFPALTWRHPAGRAKVGAEVLAWAADAAEQNVDLQQQRQRSLMLWHRCGAGRVLQLNFDESWRLRYGVGDRIHHQFWGQIVRWFASDRLSVGTDLVRMGTDRLMYTPGDVIRVKARLLDEQRQPVVTGDIRAVLTRDDEVVAAVELSADESGTGLLTGRIGDLPGGGRYQLSLAGADVDRLLQRDAADVDSVGMEIAVRATDSARERLDVVADDTVSRQLADWTGGTVVTSAQADRVLSSFGPPSSFERRRWSVPVWNSWPVMAMFLCCLSLEWTLRKVIGRV
ncbi:MAG: hypothetical protein NXI04_07945 [Planctomycetaceae bacterium]|nr:hypothetical protein [Planctomycetaceae bacterium]